MRPAVPAPALPGPHQPWHPVMQAGEPVLGVHHVDVIEFTPGYFAVESVVRIEGEKPVRVRFSGVEGDVA